MDQCAQCKKELSAAFCGVPRLPCPHCGALNRSFVRAMHETVSVTDHVSWSQRRPVSDGYATLDSKSNIELSLTGRPPRNEEGSIAVASRLVRRLNSDGCRWSDVEQGEADVDAIARDAGPPPSVLEMQVVRASSDESVWRTMALAGSVTKQSNVVECARDLLSAVEKKAKKYPLSQRQRLTLVLDSGRTPSHSFHAVHQHFRVAFASACAQCGFSSVWLVGPSDPLVFRLDQ